MFWDKWFKKETVGEPVLTLVEKVKQNPKKYSLKALGEEHIVVYFDRGVDWQLSVYIYAGDYHTNEKGNWMNKAERIYFFNELINHTDPAPYSRRGWMQKVLEEDNVN